MKKEVMILTGAGQIGMAIARRMGYGMKIVITDRVATSTKTCLHTARQDVPEQPMKWQTSPNC